MDDDRYNPFEGQLKHLVALAALIALAWAGTRLPAVREGSFAGHSTERWFWISVAVAVVHQIFVTVVWRVRLRSSAARSRDSAGRLIVKESSAWSFGLYLTVFFALFVGRMATTVVVASANAGAIHISLWARVAIAALLGAPAVYLFYSVVAYFGLLRAAGADHFRRAYAELPLVRRGIFRYTRNGMYTFGLLVLFIPGVLAGSPAAILGAAFQQAYIWVHYHATELPDMRRIYADPDRP